MTGLTKAFASLANVGRVPGDDSQTVVSEATAAAVTRTLVETVRTGTGRHAAVPGHLTAGKTGTSVIRVTDAGVAKDMQLAMFGGFVPAERPRYVALVIVEAERGPGRRDLAGGTAAAPVFREILRQTLAGPAK